MIAATQDRLRSLAGLPDPAHFARSLDREGACALIAAQWDRNAPGYRANSRQDAALLRRLGLCDCPSAISSGLMITAYGIAVRRALMEKQG